MRSNRKLFLLVAGPWAALSMVIINPAAFATPTPLVQTQPANQPDAKKNRMQAYLRYIEAQRMKSSRQTKVSDLLAVYKEIIQLDPEAADPHADLGELYLFNMRQPENAEREGQEAIRLDPNCLNGHKLLARLYIFNVRVEQTPKPAQIDRAIRAYEEVARLDATSAEAWAFLADLYQMKNDSEQQIRALEKLSAIAAPSPMEAYFYRQVMNTDLSPDQTFYQLSRLYLNQRKYSQAIDAARKAFETDPDSAVNAKNLMEALRFSANGEEELTAYVRLIKRTGSPFLQAGYGAALVRAGRYGEAITKLRELLKSDPNNAGVIELLAVAQRRTGKRAEALETLKQALPKVDLGARLKLNMALGEIYEELGRSADAVAHYEGVFNEMANKPKLTAPENETFLELVTRLTHTYNREGNKKKSQDLLARAKSVLGDNNPLVDSLLIEGLREEGKPREALEAVRNALTRYPNERSLKVTEALILSELRNFPESLDLLRSLLKGDFRNDTTILTLLSNVQLQTGQLKEAETTIRQALDAEPNDADLLIQLGSIQDRAGQQPEAEKTLRTLLQREPDNATALNNLGFFLAERNARYQEALPLIEKAVSIEPLNASFLDSLGWVQYKMGHLQEARTQLEKAISYTRRNGTIFEHLGDVLRDLGRLQEAKRYWETALEHSAEAGVIARLKNKIKNTQ